MTKKKKNHAKAFCEELTAVNESFKPIQTIILWLNLNKSLIHKSTLLKKTKTNKKFGNWNKA